MKVSVAADIGWRMMRRFTSIFFCLLLLLLVSFNRAVNAKRPTVIIGKTFPSKIVGDRNLGSGSL